MDSGKTFYLFGDQSDDTRTYLRALLQSDSDPLLDCFLRKSFDAIRTELSRFPSARRRHAKRSSSLLDLLSLKNVGARDVALDHAITVVCHFALFFRYAPSILSVLLSGDKGFMFDRRCHQAQGLYPQPPDSYLIGICTGSLAAAAISCCQTLSELLPVAVQVVNLSLHAGRLAADIGARLQVDSDSEQSGTSWALIFTGLTTDRANPVINAFSESEVSLQDGSTEYFLTTSTEITGCFSSLCEQ
jgi:Starter unit:ACP transacylase in aflatoxin biosynthesis